MFYIWGLKHNNHGLAQNVTCSQLYNFIVYTRLCMSRAKLWLAAIVTLDWFMVGVRIRHLGTQHIPAPAAFPSRNRSASHSSREGAMPRGGHFWQKHAALARSIGERQHVAALRPSNLETNAPGFETPGPSSIVRRCFGGPWTWRTPKNRLIN